MKFQLALLFMAILTAGCDKQIADFVAGGDRRQLPPPAVQPPPANNLSDEPIGTQISPGANIVAGSQVNTRFVMTTNGRTAKGSQVGSKFSFHQNRPQ